MGKLYENFNFERSHVYEMFILMLRITGIEGSEKGTYRKPEIEKLNEWFAEQRESLPSEIIEELNFFFHPDSFFGLSLTQLIYQHNKFSDMEECITFLKNTDAKQIIKYFFNTGHNYLEDDSILENTSKVHEHIKNSTLPTNEKSKLFYLYYDRNGTKRRLIKLLED